MVIENKLQKSFRNMVYGFVKYGIVTIVPFVIRTILIYRLGTEYAGVTSLFSSILQVLSLSELGFSSAIVYALYEPIAKQDVRRINAILNLFRKIYRVCGMVILTVGLLITPFVDKLIKGGHPEDVNIHIVFAMLVVNTACSYLILGYRATLLVAYERSDIESKARIISNLFIYVFQVLVLLLTQNYYLYVLCTLVGDVMNNILLYYYSKKMFPMILCQGEVDKEEKKKIFNNVKALFGHQLDAVVITSADNIVISRFIGLHVLTIYNNYYYLVAALISILVMIANSFIASIGKNIVLKSKQENYRQFVFFAYAMGLVNAFCTAMLLVLFQDFMYVWMGDSRMLTISTILFIVLAFYIRQLRRPVLTYKNAAGIWKNDIYKPYIAASVNLFLNITLVQFIGINGVIISTMISMLLVEIPWETKVLFNDYFGNGVSQYIKIQIWLFFKTVLCSIVPIILLRKWVVVSWGELIVKGICTALIVVMVLLVSSLEDKEFKDVKAYIYSSLRRRTNI